MSDIEQLVDEIRQITAQYKAEVDGGRKQWPRAIKERVLRLRVKDLSLSEISERTGISYHTVASWTAAGKDFHNLPVVSRPRGRPKKIATVTVAKNPRTYERNKVVTVTVKTPDGFVLQVPSLTDAILTVQKLRRGP